MQNKNLQFKPSVEKILVISIQSSIMGRGRQINKWNDPIDTRKQEQQCLELETS